MRITQPVNNEPTLLYNTVKIQGCVDSTVGFNFLKSEPTVSKRRYCNKVLVHECIPANISDPTELLKVEFLSTSDPCYAEFNIFKTSDADDYDDYGVEPTIELQFDEDDYEKVIGVLVHFSLEETCGQPLGQAYRLYGYTPEGDKILLSNGILAITSCSCPESVEPTLYTDKKW